MLRIQCWNAMQVHKFLPRFHSKGWNAMQVHSFRFHSKGCLEYATGEISSTRGSLAATLSREMILVNKASGILFSERNLRHTSSERGMDALAFQSQKMGSYFVFSVED